MAISESDDGSADEDCTGGDDCSCIEVGSTWAFTDDVDLAKPAHRSFEVANVRLESDGSVAVSVDYGKDTEEPTIEVTAEDIRRHEQGGTLERTNTGFEAWERRTDREGV